MSLKTNYLVFISLFLLGCDNSVEIKYDLLLERQPSVIVINGKGAVKLDTVSFSGEAYNTFPEESKGNIKKEAGRVYISFKIQKPLFTYLNINERRERAFVVPNDTLRIDLDYDAQIEKFVFARFKGITADINYYRQAKEKTLEIKDFVTAKGSLPSQAPSLEFVKSVTDSVTNLELNYLEKARFEYNLPDWFYDLERFEIIYFGAAIKIGAPEYRKTLMGLDEKVPEGYFDFIDKIPVNNQN